MQFCEQQILLGIAWCGFCIVLGLKQDVFCACSSEFCEQQILLGIAWCGFCIVPGLKQDVFCVCSSEFCEQQLQLMFTIMEKSPSEVIRANSIIAVGDLTFRFPNLIEPWTPHLYGR